MVPRLMLLALLLVPVLTAPARAEDFFFKAGDVVVQMGDSITEQRLHSKYVEMWSVTRFPAWNLTFRNVGIGGDRSPGGNNRFKRDVLPYKPTALTVDFGMNDGSYRPFEEATFAPYMKGLQGIADQAKAANIRVAWITPQPIERKEPGPQLTDYNLTLEKFSEGVKQIAKKNGGLFVDQFHPYLAVIEQARKTDDKIRITAGDAVHPGPPGQALMAASILKAMSFPREVSVVSLGVGNSKTAFGSRACSIKDIKQSDSHAMFTRVDEALPYFPAEAKSMLKWAPLLEEMNHYGLQVPHLKPGAYEIRIDGVKIAEHSADELAKGVNLAAAVLAKGPIADQVDQVAKAVDKKTNYFHDEIFRGLILANAKSPAFKDVPPGEMEATRQKLIAERMQRMPELDAAIRQALVLRPHTFEIVAVAKN
jgi:lysophospholipase L1-like esterase